MNLRKFKEEVRTWENYEENFDLFRIWAENSYELFKKNLELDIADDKLLELNDTENYENKLRHMWEGLDLKIIFNLYSKMGWKIDDRLKNKEISQDNERVSVYYDSRLSDAMEKLKTVEDDVEFCYGILYLAKQVDNPSRIYNMFIKRILLGLKEYNLNDCLSMLGTDVKKVFIAMWFDDSMEEARNSIVNSINDCGYKAMLIDIKEHNNQIVPEIFKEIDESEFVVADLTGQRGGVYYEAGYAMAKGKPVILSCKDEEETHFDVAQINTIYWKDEQDLYNRLMKRIEATIRRKS